jgi:hypothetical protein
LSVKDLWQTLVIIVTTFSITLIFFYSLLKGKFIKLKRFEIRIIVFIVIIIFIWITTGNSKIANIILQIIYVVSYVPVAISVTMDSSTENPVAWVIATIAYVFATLAIVCNYTGEIVSLIYPIVNGILGNGIITILIFRNKKNSLTN